MAPRGHGVTKLDLTQNSTAKADRCITMSINKHSNSGGTGCLFKAVHQKRRRANAANVNSDQRLCMAQRYGHGEGITPRLGTFHIQHGEGITLRHIPLQGHRQPRPGDAAQDIGNTPHAQTKQTRRRQGTARQNHESRGDGKTRQSYESHGDGKASRRESKPRKTTAIQWMHDAMRRWQGEATADRHMTMARRGAIWPGIPAAIHGEARQRHREATQG